MFIPVDSIVEDCYLFAQDYSLHKFVREFDFSLPPPSPFERDMIRSETIPCISKPVVSDIGKDIHTEGESKEEIRRTRKSPRNHRAQQ